MTSEQRLKQIQFYISRMPSLSTTVTKVLEVCNSPETSPDELNRLISYDPVLTGQVLRLINSAYYSLPNRVTSLSRAIIMLGLNTVKNLVLASAVLSSFSGKTSIGAFSMDDFWAHCLCVGVTTKAIARLRNVPVVEQEEYFVTGLLHDLGKLPMMVCFAELYDEAARESREADLPLYLAERKRIGFDHCQVGWLIGAKWRLSNGMKYAIVNHHQPLGGTGEARDLLYALSLGNQVAHHLRIGGAGDSASEELLIHELAERMAVGMDDLLKMRPQIEDEIDKARIFLKNNRKGAAHAT